MFARQVGRSICDTPTPLGAEPARTLRLTHSGRSGRYVPWRVRGVSVVSAACSVKDDSLVLRGPVGLPKPSPSRAGSARDFEAERRAPRRFLGGWVCT
jgi:hypothetical protein